MKKRNEWNSFSSEKSFSSELKTFILSIGIFSRNEKLQKEMEEELKIGKTEPPYKEFFIRAQKRTVFNISISESLSNNKYMYLSVSAKKKLSMSLFGFSDVSVLLTSLYEVYAISVLQYFSMD